MKTAKKTSKSGKKTAEAAKKRPQAPRGTAKAARMSEAQSVAGSARRPLPPNVKTLVTDLQGTVGRLVGLFGARPDLTPAQRNRLQGSGIRRYGFIDKVLDVSETNTKYAPGTFDRALLLKIIENIEGLRNVRIAALQFIDAIDDYLLKAGDDAFRIALIYYNTVRDLARHGDGGAREVFNQLRPFFARTRMAHEEEKPVSKKQALKDAKAVAAGRKDGVVTFEGKAKRTSKGERVIVDETSKPRGGVKVTAQAGE